MASRDGFKQIIKQESTPKENIQSVWVKRIGKRYSQVRKHGKSKYKTEV